MDSKKASKKASNTLETWGNESTMNLNAIIYQNILSSPYFRSLYNKKTFHEIVDEIYNEAPFIKGTQPSTAFCCLFKMWTLRLTIKQIENLIDHVDSPPSRYIRAIGFLYLRYVCAPAQLWDWFQYYLEDDEVVQISSGQNPTKITIGKLCRMLITEPKFQGTMLPRIPVPIARDLEKKLQQYDREHRTQPVSEARVNDDKEEIRGSGGDRYRSKSRERYRSRSRDRYRSRSRDRYRSRSRDRCRSRSPSSRRHHRQRDEYDDYYERSRKHRSSSRDEYRDYRRKY
ncbi:PRP38 family-domain-containing protein [Blakeslea trispora]|nr:PRP38 family-domain-containing protein [Blakeslea trispora]